MTEKRDKFGRRIYIFRLGEMKWEEGKSWQKNEVGMADENTQCLLVGQIQGGDDGQEERRKEDDGGW